MVINKIPKLYCLKKLLIKQQIFWSKKINDLRSFPKLSLIIKKILYNKKLFIIKLKKNIIFLIINSFC